MKTKWVSQLWTLIFLIVFFGTMTACSSSSNGNGKQEGESYTVSGQITDAEGVGLEGVTLEFSEGFGVVKTDENGFWEKSNLKGNVLVTPELEGILAFSPHEKDVFEEDTGVDFEVLVTEQQAKRWDETSDDIRDIIKPLWEEYRTDAKAQPLKEAPVMKKQNIKEVISQIEALDGVKSVKNKGNHLEVKFVDGPVEEWYITPYKSSSPVEENSNPSMALSPLQSPLGNQPKNNSETYTAALVHPLAVRTEDFAGWNYQQNKVPKLLIEMKETLKQNGYESVDIVPWGSNQNADIDFYKDIGKYDFVFTYGHGSDTSVMTDQSAPWYRQLSRSKLKMSNADEIRVGEWGYGKFWMLTPKFFEEHVTFERRSLFIDWGCRGLYNIPPGEGIAQAVISSGAFAYVAWDHIKGENVEGAVALISNMSDGMGLEEAIIALPYDMKSQWWPYSRHKLERYKGENIQSLLTFFPKGAANAGLLPPVKFEIKFASPGLKQAIRETIDKPEGTIYSHDLAAIKNLNARERNIESIDGIQHLTNLEVLDLGENQITDLSALKGIEKLRSLNFSGNQVMDISVVAELDNLRNLVFDNNKVEGIPDLGDLANLWNLNFSDNQVEDISGLKNLTSLQDLTFSNNRVSDISALEGLEKLEFLLFSGNKVSSLEALSGLENLEQLNFVNNNVKDISALGNIVNLKWLVFSGNQVKDLSPLENLTNLSMLIFDDNQVTNISPLVNNEGFGQDDSIHMRGNPLELFEGSQAMQDINALLERGVSVDFDEQEDILDPPENLAAVTGDRQITVTWDAMEGATGYYLYYGRYDDIHPSHGDSYDGLIELGDVSQYTVEGLDNDTTYYFVLTTDVSGSESAPSNVVSATPKELVTDADKTNSIGMDFVYIEPGTFMMGSPEDEPGRFSRETQHQVTLTQGYHMQTTPVTQGQWEAVMGDNPSYFDECGDDCPVERVSWQDAQDFITALNQQEGTTGYALPTEAQWEYAARAGSTTAFANGQITETGSGYDPVLDSMGWYIYNSHADHSTHSSGRGTHPVAQKDPNAWGLYDMHGNVWEWIADWYGTYPSSAVTDPTGPSSGTYRVVRGGGWLNYARGCRSATRGYYAAGPGVRHYGGGFRLVLLPGH